MKNLYLRKATIKAKVLETRIISKDEVELQVLIKKIEYETINRDTGKCKNGKIELEDFSERGAFIARNWMCGPNFTYIASQLVRDDVIVFSIMHNGGDKYLFTSLRFDYDFCKGSVGILSLIKKYKGV